MIMNTNFIQMKTISVDKSKETSVTEVITNGGKPRTCSSLL